MTTLPTRRPASTEALLGVMDVGGSHAVAAAVDLARSPHAIVDRSRVELDAAAGRTELLARLWQPAVALHRAGMNWTIALPGPFDYARGEGDFAGVGKFASIARVNLRVHLAEALRIPPGDVHFVNDAEAFAVGEWAASDARRPRFIGITLGTGVGSAFLAEGRAVSEGADVPPHGWAHLILIDGAPLEERVSTAAIMAAYRERSGSTATVREIARRAADGDAVAAEVFGAAMRTLGRALGPWCVRFAADELVIGGAMARAWALIEAPLRSGLADAGTVPPLLRPARLGDDAALIGAAEWTAPSSPTS